jgi:hypothetical protein
VRIVVFGDGHTWSVASDVRVMDVDREEYAKLSDGATPNQLLEEDRLPYTVASLSSRWQVLKRKSPSGKVLYVCTVCGRTSPFPDKRCEPVEGVDCAQEEALWGRFES